MMNTRLINKLQKNKSDFKVRFTLALMRMEKLIVLTEKARSGLPGFRIKHDLSHLFIAILFFIIAGTASAGHPLEPVDTSSPRATIESFYALTKETGVGGLAVALAARSTLENFMGTLNLFADRPIRVGEICYYGEGNSPGQQRIGTVEEIGLRSTSIRGLDRSITTIPNASFSNLHITNLTKRDRILFRKTIHLRYETTSEQMRQLLIQLREMLSVHPQIDNENARVRALGFGEYSLDVEIYAYVMATEWSDFLVVQEDLVLRIMDIIDKAGMVIAIPSRTVYQRQDVEPGIETGSVSQDDVELPAPSI